MIFEKKSKKRKTHAQPMPNYPYLYLIMYARDTILHIKQLIIITKANVKFQSGWLKIFQGKVTKV